MNWTKIRNHLLVFTSISLGVGLVFLPFLILVTDSQYASIDVRDLGIRSASIHEFFSEAKFFVLIPIFIISLIFYGIWLLLVSIAREMGKRIMRIAGTGILLMIVLEIILEHPAFLGLDIMFPKAIETKILYASTDYHKSLSAEEKVTIYLLVLDDKYPCMVLDALSNTAGNHYHDRQYMIPMDNELKQRLLGVRNDSDFRIKMISTYSEGLEENYRVRAGYAGIYRLTPIKQIGAYIYVGYDRYFAPREAASVLFQIKNVNGKWTIVKTIDGWVS